VPENPSDVSLRDEDLAAGPTGAARDSSSGRRRVRVRSDWRQGGHAVRRWNTGLLSIALFGVGLGLVGSTLLGQLSFPGAAVASSAALWIGLGVPVIVALRRGRPAGLFRVRSIDLLWGLGIGGALRLLQGWLNGANSSPFPTLGSTETSSTWEWMWSSGIPSVFVSPLIEEFFFRAVILVGVYQLLRRSVGVVAAATTGLLVSAGGFVLLHGAFSPLPLGGGIQLFAVGAACALLVLLSGRIWGAVLAHVVYNLSYLLLAIVGTMLA